MEKILILTTVLMVFLGAMSLFSFLKLERFKKEKMTEKKIMATVFAAYGAGGFAVSLTILIITLLVKYKYL